MAIATGLVTATKSRKFPKCCAFVRPVYDDLVVPGHLIIIHGRLSWTSLSSMGDFIVQEQYYRPWTSFLLLGWFLILLALLALDDPFRRTGVGLIFHFPINIYIYMCVYVCMYVCHAINNLLFWISCNNRLLLYEFYCNKLKIIYKNKLDQISFHVCYCNKLKNNWY